MSTLGMAAVAAVPMVTAGAGFVTGRLSTRRTMRRARIEADRQLAIAQRAALYDPLTGLRNRAGLLAEMDRWTGGRESFGVLLADLNGFKVVNDRYGHAAGDVVLVDVALRLAKLVGRAGFVARLGGDEFVLVAASPSPVISRLLGYDVARAVARPIDVNGRTVTVRASVGVVQALPGDDAAALLHSADIAMFRAKSGRGQAGVAEFDALRGPARVAEDRPGVRLRELAKFGADLAEVA
jgi:diguanylate cyclase (GGDEF)-like protein